MNKNCCCIDDEGAVGGEGIAAVDGREGEGGAIACGVCDGGAVEDERCGGFVVEAGGGIAVLDRVVEGEGARAGAGGVGGVAVCRTGFEAELGSAA